MSENIVEKMRRQKAEIALFLKRAFCADGEAKFLESRAFKIQGVVELNDSVKGKFYIAYVKPWTWHFKNLKGVSVKDLGGIEHQDFKTK